MPASPAIDDQPFTVAPFDLDLHVAPLELFDRLRSGAPPLLVDLRTAPSTTSLRGAVPWHRAASAWRSGAWPFGAVEALLFDDDGDGATLVARALRAAGRPHVRALYGGLRLYVFTLHPAVVREDRFLRESGSWPP